MTLNGARVLYISYNGMLDSLGQTQVIPYVRELSRAGVQFSLLSFEKPHAYTEAGREVAKQLHRELSASGIDWHWLPYHKRPSLAATGYDVLAGTRYASRLVKQRNIEMVHTRGHIAATMALRLKQRFGIKFIFDIRGLMAEEYIDAGHWRERSMPVRLTKHFESRALQRADGIVVLTERIWPILSEWEELRGKTISHEIIPCCADLDKFKFSSEHRHALRQQLDIEDRFVFVYSGSIDGWYLTEEMADFFAVLLRKRPDALLLWLTQSNEARLRELMRARGISEDDYRIVASRPADVPGYLSASDVGLSFIKPCFSKLASSPTKYAEYLGCGLPLIINAGVGDSDALVTEHAAGVLIHEFNEDEYAKAIDHLMNQSEELPEQGRQRMRLIAEKLFDLQIVGVPKYARLYEQVLGT